MPTKIPDAITKHNSIVITYGPTGSFGYCCSAPEARQMVGWWSNWSVPDLPKSNIVDPDVVRRQLKERHGTWKDPVIQNIIESTTTDRIYPIWTTPNLPHWGGNGVVLLGDAAHTLQATSGQGASQALEDSVVFTLLLRHYITKAATVAMTAKDTVDLSIKGLYEIRNPRTAYIRAQGRNLLISSSTSNSIVLEYLFYCLLYIWTNFPIISESPLELLNSDSSNFTLGNVISGEWFKQIHEWDAAEQVKIYLDKKNQE